MFTKIFKPAYMTHWWQDALITIPRIVYGYLLAADFGASKFGMPWSPKENNLNLFEVAFWFPTDVAEFGPPFSLFPVFFAWMAAFSEAVGGIFWILGFNVRVFSLLIGITMFVAVFIQQGDKGMWNMLPGLGCIWLSIFYLVIGSGRFGIDHLIYRKFKK
jgi:putative oxidoreductase